MEQSSDSADAVVGREKVMYPRRPKALVLLACLVSLFLPGLGHLVLGYFRPGLKWLGLLVAAFAVAVFLALVLHVSNTLAALPIFFVWLAAVQELWTMGTVEAEEA